MATELNELKDENGRLGDGWGTVGGRVGDWDGRDGDALRIGTFTVSNVG